MGSERKERANELDRRARKLVRGPGYASAGSAWSAGMSACMKNSVFESLTTG